MGPFSAFVKAGGLVFLSGQVGLKDGKLISSDLQSQVEQAVANIVQVLGWDGLSLLDIVDITVFLADMNDYAAFNTVYENVFRHVKDLPTRTCVAVAALPLGARVELKVIAARRI